MSKNLKPSIRGETAQKCLSDLMIGYADEMHPQSDTKIPRTLLRKIFSVTESLRDLVNLDACVNEWQRDKLKPIIEKSVRNNEDGEDVLIALPIATYINTLRHQCADCLNLICERRDPSTKG